MLTAILIIRALRGTWLRRHDRAKGARRRMQIEDLAPRGTGAVTNTDPLRIGRRGSRLDTKYQAQTAGARLDRPTPEGRVC